MMNKIALALGLFVVTAQASAQDLSDATLSVASETKDAWEFKATPKTSNDPGEIKFYESLSLVVSKAKFKTSAEALSFCQSLGNYTIPRDDRYTFFTMTKPFVEGDFFPPGHLRTDYPTESFVSWLSPDSIQKKGDVALVFLKEGDGKIFKIKDLNVERAAAGLPEFSAPVICLTKAFAENIENAFKQW